VTDLTPLLIAPDITLRDAMVRMGAVDRHILLVVDGDHRLLGTITDGDIRRSILRAVPLEEPVTAIMNGRPISIDAGADRSACLAVMNERRILHLPKVDAAGRVVSIVLLEDMIRPVAADQPNWVVLMAGGLGSRLRPLTDDIPKPLLPVGGRPILETILEQLRDHGFHHFYISVNYKAEAVKGHFGDGSRFGVEIRYLEESEPLGTAGPLGLIPERPDAPLLVMNGDLLTKLDFRALFNYHREHDARMTICVREFDMQVPYGVVEFDNNRVRDIIEKPVHRFMVNAGIYVLDAAALDHIPAGRRFDMPDLSHRLIAGSEPVFGYPIHEYWIDIGRLEDFHRAGREFPVFFSSASEGLL
jgi:dTDP-glucose pyrophosphorylase/CBS domain-containing protein